MANKIKCIVCGTEYEACKSCNDNHLSSWRIITDTANHFNIFLIVNDYYNKVITKDEAMKLIKQCDISGYEKFSTNIKVAIERIIKVDEIKNKVIPEKKKRENKANKK